MPADKEYADAKRALEIIEKEALATGKHLTVGRLAEMLGHDGRKQARHLGQVCSLIDSACYWTKLPMLALEKIRMDNGNHNPDSFGGAFAPIKSQLAENAAGRNWSSDDLKHIKRVLDQHMNGERALRQWERITSFGRTGLDRLESYK